METTFWLGGDRYCPANRERLSRIFALAEQPL
jgi:hypothetical protein